MIKNNNRNIIKILLANKKVNNYTKLMIYLNTLDYYEDYYIPNKKLMNILGIRKHRLIGLLHQLENDNIISIRYKGRKRYFMFIKNNEDKEEISANNDVFNYNWLEEDD